MAGAALRTHLVVNQSTTKYMNHVRSFAQEIMKVLLVDDEPDILTAVKRGLELRGLSVDAFDDPETALSQFKPNTYDIAILDVRMPKMNGFQLYRELIRRDDNIKVRFFTAFEEYRDEFKVAFPELDENRFIRKPASIGKIAEELLADVKVNADTKPRSTASPP
jgi:two-component system, OmpR family, response regulator ChvI